MPIEEIHLALPNKRLPKKIEEYLIAADKCCDAFFDSEIQKTVPRFIPADYPLIAKTLIALEETGMLLGNRFCEWGSGLGTATCLASLLGFEAAGIEIEAELVERATLLARDFSIVAEFIETSFLPPGYDFLPTHGGRELVVPAARNASNPIYPDTDWEIEEVDVFYVYPWPEEQESTLALFEAIATDGAFLLCYFGEGDICAYRKTVD